VLDGADHAPPLVPRQGVPCQRPAAARQWCEAFPERRVASLPGRRRAHAVPLRPAAARLHACRCAINPAACGLDDTAPLGAREDVGAHRVRPRTQPRSSACPRRPGRATGLPYGAAVCHHAIGTAPQGLTSRTASHAHQHPPDQGQVPRLADRTAQPPARLAPHSACPPHAAALLLDAALIGLYLAHVPWLFD